MPIARDSADRDDILHDRNVDHRIGAVAGAAVTHAGQRAVGQAGDGAEVRFPGDDAHRATHRSRPEQGSLGPSQDFDTIDVEGPEITERRVDLGNRRLVDIDAGGRQDARGHGVAQPANEDLILIAILGICDARDRVQKVGVVRRPHLAQAVAGEHGDRCRNVLHAFTALLRRHDDVAGLKFKGAAAAEEGSVAVCPAAVVAHSANVKATIPVKQARLLIAPRILQPPILQSYNIGR